MAIINWTIKNLSNIFSVLGIILTFYFGIYYVPEWLEDIQDQKQINAQENLIQSIKELVYSDSICTYPEIDILIKAKELDLKRSYPFKPTEVLIAVQESFMQDKYLPLEKRKQLLYEIEALKKVAPKPIIQNDKKTDTDGLSFYTLLSGIISSIIALSGIISLYWKSRDERAKQEEIDNQIVDSDQNINSTNKGHEFEGQVINEIKAFPDVVPQPLDSTEAFDFKFLYKSKLFYVEVRYLTDSKVSLRSIHGFISKQKGLEGTFWFVYNTDITGLVKEEVDKWNKITAPGRRIELIKVENMAVLKQQLTNMLK